MEQERERSALTKPFGKADRLEVVFRDGRKETIDNPTDEQLNAAFQPLQAIRLAERTIISKDSGEELDFSVVMATRTLLVVRVLKMEDGSTIPVSLTAEFQDITSLLAQIAKLVFQDEKPGNTVAV